MKPTLADPNAQHIELILGRIKIIKRLSSNEKIPLTPEMMIATQQQIDNALNQLIKNQNDRSTRLSEEELSKILIIDFNDEKIEVDDQLALIDYTIENKIPDRYPNKPKKSNLHSKINCLMRICTFTSCNQDALANIEKGEIKLIHFLMLYKQSTLYTETPTELKGFDFEKPETYYDMMRYLLESGIDVNMQDTRKATALHIAAELKDVETVKFLTEQPAIDPNLQDEDGGAVLHFLAQKTEGKSTSDEQEIIKYLLSIEGIDVNIKDSEGFTPLHIAAYDGKIWIIKALLGKAAQVNTQELQGFTPFHSAIRNGLLKTAQTLFKNNADVSKQARFGLTPLAVGLFYIKETLLADTKTKIVAYLLSNELLDRGSLSSSQNQYHKIIRRLYSPNGLNLEQKLLHNVLNKTLDPKSNPDWQEIFCKFITQESIYNLTKFVLSEDGKNFKNALPDLLITAIFFQNEAVMKQILSSEFAEYALTAESFYQDFPVNHIKKMSQECQDLANKALNKKKDKAETQEPEATKEISAEDKNETGQEEIQDLADPENQTLESEETRRGLQFVRDYVGNTMEAFVSDRSSSNQINSSSEQLIRYLNENIKDAQKLIFEIKCGALDGQNNHDKALNAKDVRKLEEFLNSLKSKIHNFLSLKQKELIDFETNEDFGEKAHELIDDCKNICDQLNRQLWEFDEIESAIREFNQEIENRSTQQENKSRTSPPKSTLAKSMQQEVGRLSSGELTQIVRDTLTTSQTGQSKVKGSKPHAGQLEKRHNRKGNESKNRAAITTQFVTDIDVIKTIIPNLPNNITQEIINLVVLVVAEEIKLEPKKTKSGSHCLECKNAPKIFPSNNKQKISDAKEVGTYLSFWQSLSSALIAKESEKQKPGSEK